MNKIDRGSSQGKPPAYDLDSLLHPAQAFEHPSRVVSDPDLTLNEKRAILSSWASDACAIEAAPTDLHDRRRRQDYVFQSGGRGLGGPYPDHRQR